MFQELLSSPGLDTPPRRGLPRPPSEKELPVLAPALETNTLISSIRLGAPWGLFSAAASVPRTRLAPRRQEVLLAGWLGQFLQPLLEVLAVLGTALMLSV